MNVERITVFLALGLGLVGTSRAAAAVLNAEPPTARPSEYEILRRFPNGRLERCVAGGRPDQDGLVGHHRSAKTWYDPALQRGACWYLIGAVVKGDTTGVDEAWKAIDATFARQLPDGGYLCVAPPGVMKEPSLFDRQQGGYFFIQELSHALLVVSQSPMAPSCAARIDALRPKVRKACDFIAAGYNGIIKNDSKATNRVFIAAKSLALSGVLLDEPRYTALSRQLVAHALTSRDAAGVFIENQGRDSSYNAVSLLMSQVILLYQPDADLSRAIDPAMQWELTRVRPSGEVDVTGNSRTGVGKETFLGNPKNVNYMEVELALLYYAATRDSQEAWESADRVFRYAISR